MNETPTPEVKPEIVFVYEIIRGVAEGRTRIPSFQRPFVWRRDQMLDLLDSIRQQYPIGSLLVWETSERLSSLERVGHVRIQQAPQGAVSYVLDGHQRLSTLTGVLTEATPGAPPDDEDPARWTVWYNARDQLFEHPGPEARLEWWHFPLSRLMSTLAFLNECQRMLKQGGDAAHPYVERVQRLAQMFQEYKLPLIRIKETDLRQAVEIFARLNSKGQRMTADQMVSALAYEEDSGGQPVRHLARDIDEILAALADKGFGEVDRTIVLRAILATLGEDLYRTDWTRMAQDKRSELLGRLPGAVGRTQESLLRAAEFLGSLGVHTDRLLPYAMQAVLLSAFFAEQPRPTPVQERLLRRTFWFTSFTAWFASGNPSRVRDLIAEFRGEVAKDPAATTLKNLKLEEPALPFPKTFDTRSARARTFLLVLLSLQPRNPDGSEVVDPWKLIADEGSLGVGNIVATVASKELYSSPANRVVRPKRDRTQAKTWLLTATDEVWESHGIPPEARPSLESGDHVAFLQMRLTHLIDIERRFMADQSVSPSLDQTPQAAPVDTDE